MKEYRIPLRRGILLCRGAFIAPPRLTLSAPGFFIYSVSKSDFRMETSENQIFFRRKNGQKSDDFSKIFLIIIQIILFFQKFLFILLTKFSRFVTLFR